MSSHARICKTCTIEKSIEDFPRAANSWRWECKSCRSQREVERKMVSRYGLTLDGKAKILEAQGGVCKICGSGDPRHMRGWALDHDHDTDEVRGVLCQPCNLALGALETLHRAALLGRALAYAGIQSMERVQK